MKHVNQTTFGIACMSAAAALALFGATQINAQRDQDRGPPGGGKKPTEAMLKACTAKKANDACSAEGPDGNVVAGSCFAPADLPLACRPAGRPARGTGPEGQ
ncbi:hypothetical protein [Sphingorhabdus sp. 109]|jgi:hypothetical protein|uniref:hypothetical protein n=1 Tax=Sphingorhabdus sp. 109 TaxID=2653173 RepID=UPI0012EF8F6E|nr:hypothetical protein [Sphingorhabdus sp. 109]VWX62078.1 exported hypothetical protein [Sphingorhabdus sp. 109]